MYWLAPFEVGVAIIVAVSAFMFAIRLLSDDE